MKINLNPDTFTQITDGDRVLVQFRSGVADVAGSSDPAEGDWITFASGEKAYLEIESWGRGVGYAVLLEEGENPDVPGGMDKPELSVVGDDIEVSFDPPGGSVTGYDVRYSTNETDWTVVSSVSSPYVIPDTDGATTYYVQVRAKNSSGAGPWSESAIVTTGAEAPSAPDAPIVVAVDESTLRVTWTAPSDGGSPILGYNLRYSTNMNDWEIETDVTSPFDIEGLDPSTTYYVEVMAYNAEGNSQYSNPGEGETEGPAATVPGKVANLRVTSKTDTTISLAWDAPDDGGSPITGYRVYESGSLAKNVTGLTTTIVDLTPETEYKFRVSAVNVEGEGVQSDELSVTTDEEGQDNPYPVEKLQGPTTTIEYRGATFSFSEPVYWIESAVGDPVVITDAERLPNGTTVTSITPASATNPTGYKWHGTVKNPIHFPDGPETRAKQGFDERMEVVPGGSIYTDYRDSLNIDPANTSSPIVIATGETLTLVKAICDETVGDAAGKVVEQYVPLTFIDHLPPRDGTWFRPSVSEQVKEWPIRTLEEIDFSGGPESPLRNLPALPGTEEPGFYVDRIRNNDKAVTLPIWVNSGESGRKMQLVGETNSSYSEDIAKHRVDYTACLLTDWSSNPTAQEDRKELGALVTQWGIDRDGAQRDGYQNGNAGAGQNYGYHPIYYFASFLLGDPDMLYRCQWHRSNPFNQIFWVQEDLIGYPVRWDSGSDGSGRRTACEVYQKEHLDLPEWTKNGWFPVTSGDGSVYDMPGGLRSYRLENSSWAGMYRDTNYEAGIPDALPVYLLRNGPEGETGADVINRGLPVGPDNIASAPLPYYDRTMTFVPQVGRRGITGATRIMYEAWRDFVPQDKWTGQPESMSNGEIDPPSFVPGATAGTATIDLTAYDFSTKPIQTREAKYSMDGIQWSDPLTISDTDTITGLREGTQYRMSWRQINEDDEYSIWSPHWVHALITGTAAEKLKQPRNLVETTGTPSGALTNEAPPRLAWKPYPLHPTPHYEDLSTMGPEGVYSGITLYAGMGFWSGGSGAPKVVYNWDYSDRTITGWDVEFQWKRDGVAISGADEYKYTVSSEDQGASITCDVTVEGVTVSTDAAVVPTEPKLLYLLTEANGPESLDVSVFSTNDAGDLYWVVSKSATTPSLAQIKAGQDHNGDDADAFGQQEVLTLGDQELYPKPRGLDPETQYHIHLVQEVDNETVSNIITSDQVVTDEAGTISILGINEVYSGYSASVAMDLPTHISEGSLLVMFVRAWRQGALEDPPFAAGWTRAYHYHDYSDGLQIYTKVADGSEGGTTLTWTSPQTTFVAAVLYELSDVTPVQFTNAVAIAKELNNNSITPPELIVEGAEPTLWVTGYALTRSGIDTTSIPDGFDGPYEGRTNGAHSNNEGSQLMATAYAREETNYMGPSDFAYSSARPGVAFTAALRAS